MAVSSLLMQQHLVGKHLAKPHDFSFNVRDNIDPIRLVWEGEIYNDEQPLLRANYKDLEVSLAIHLAECDTQDRLAKYNPWRSIESGPIIPLV